MSTRPSLLFNYRNSPASKRQVANSGAEQVLVKQAGTVSDQIVIASRAGNQQEERSYDLRVVLSPEVVVGTYPLHLSMQTTVL